MAMKLRTRAAWDQTGGVVDHDDGKAGKDSKGHGQTVKDAAGTG